MRLEATWLWGSERGQKWGLMHLGGAWICRPLGAPRCPMERKWAGKWEATVETTHTAIPHSGCRWAAREGRLPLHLVLCLETQQ